jgi:hypothetical protein
MRTLVVLMFCILSAPFVSAAPDRSESQPSNCPIEITSFKPVQPTVYGSFVTHVLPTVRIAYKNTGEKEISGIKFGITYYNGVGEAHDAFNTLSTGRHVKPGKKSGDSWDGEENNPAKATVHLEKVLFADGTTWEDDGSQKCSRDWHFPKKEISEAKSQ